MKQLSSPGTMTYFLLPAVVGLVFLFIQHNPARHITDLWLQRMRSTVALAAILTLIATDPAGYSGAGLQMNRSAWPWLLSGSALIGLLNVVVHHYGSLREDFGLFLHTRWSLLRILQHNIVCLLYITSYECFLRGWLLQMQMQRFGIIPAVALNTILYTLLHLPKGKKEMAGSAIFGIFMCSAVIQSGSLWPAIGLHGLLAHSFENGMIGYSFRIKKQRL